MTVSTSIQRRKPSQAPLEKRAKAYCPPPRTPLVQSSDSSTPPNRSRKRTRPSASPIQNTPWSTNANNWSHISSAASIARSDAMSPQPFANTQYILKDGLESPNQDLEDEEDHDTDFRRCWNMANQDRVSTPHSGWGKFVFNIAGSLAGRMWNFCSSVPFRGFAAGGGQAVPVNPESFESLQQASSMWEEVSQPPTHEAFYGNRMTPIPGQFPVDDPFATSESTPPRPSKRVHVDSGTSWMVVPSRGMGDCEPASACNSPRLSDRKIPSQSYIPRPSLPSPKYTPNRYFPRRSLIPISRRSSLVGSTQSPSLRPASRQSSYFESSPATRPRSYNPTNPFAPYHDRPYTPTNLPSHEDERRSPLSPEVQEIAEKIRQDEELADESMRNMSMRLADLIREGQNALKSSYGHRDEHMSYDDEGFEEGIF
ncbi:hypothetical protein EJ05DRAFT_496070 [Pseudovirgaria hyperparasitica]|uniref:Uncharacterized protein n=1 Tax=Pseudovirgaria hyperparasitica TaxID=470096 RepID=A0A6A6WM01_9PEZI|nr:uncharacterized protein EJ05DRAFT_496070 [Pseudovirgaria hyperparasitica]KAF2763240.1 hypothetical protein EJ05DRAFT_496070 [Pseudovirgaria hyperparasitica]